MRFGLIFVSVLTVLSACRAAPERRSYELRGQVLAIDRANRTVTVSHEDIQNFMPGMTMAFGVERAELLDAAAPGDLIRATLVVEGSIGRLADITVTGKAPLPASAPPPAYDILDPGEPVPELTFLDQAGARRTLDDWRGQAIGVTFVYTRCPLPDFCPAMDRRFREVQSAIAGSEALRGQAHLLSITVDPAYDTPDVLAAHARALDADPAIWSFVTGDPEALDAFGRRFGVSVLRESADAPEVVHNLRTAVIDAKGRLTTIHTGSDWSAAELVADLERAATVR